MKLLSFMALAIAMLALESVFVKAFGLELTRFDASIALVVYVALRSTVIEGALIAFCVGYTLDVMSGHPTNLYPALAALVFVLIRAFGQVFDAKSRPMFAMLVAGASFLHALSAFFLTWLTSKADEGRVASLAGIPMQALFAGLVGALLFPVLKRIEPGERPKAGTLL